MEDKLKVIFIEDDPNLGLIIVLALQSKGYEVYYANTLSGIQDIYHIYWRLSAGTFHTSIIL